MKLLRHYFVSDNLDDLELFEEQLEADGVSTPQIHILSLDTLGLERHPHLHEVQSVMKYDVVHSSLIGAGVGLCCVFLFLSATAMSAWASSAIGWMPFIFLAVVILGFCTWEGGLIGSQRRNYKFARFEKQLKDGNHIFFVDIYQHQESILARVVDLHPQISAAGTGRSVPDWLVHWQRRMGMIRHS
ncbi:MAG: hypothetical protein WCJ34_15470 [Alcaligenaceae bacterium]|jgi:hypothetical protein